jgi:hypothetical protein
MNDDPTIAELHTGIWWLPRCPRCGLAIHLKLTRITDEAWSFVLGWHPGCDLPGYFPWW